MILEGGMTGGGEDHFDFSTNNPMPQNATRRNNIFSRHPIDRT